MPDNNTETAPIESMPQDVDVLVKYHSGRGGRFAVANMIMVGSCPEIYMSNTDTEIDPDWLDGWMPIPTMNLISLLKAWDEAEAVLIMHNAFASLPEHAMNHYLEVQQMRQSALAALQMADRD